MGNQSVHVCSSRLCSRPCHLVFQPSDHAFLTFKGHVSLTVPLLKQMNVSIWHWRLSVVKCTIVIPIQFFLSVHCGWLVSFPSQFRCGQRQRILSWRCTQSEKVEACVVSIIVFPQTVFLSFFSTSWFSGVSLFSTLICFSLAVWIRTMTAQSTFVLPG